MNPTRIIYDDTPAFIPVPHALQHRKTEVIVWPLDGAAATPQAEPTTPRPVGLAKDRGIPLPNEILAAFGGEG